MKKIISLVLAMVLVLSSMSALAAGVAPATGTSNIKCELDDVTVKVRTVKVAYENANFDASDDVTFLFYAPESETSDNIIDTNIYHADQVDYSADGYTFTLSNDVPAGTYNLLIGGTDEDVPCLVKGLVLGSAVTYGDVCGADATINEPDGIIDSKDAVRILKYAFNFTAEKEAFTEYPNLAEAADVTHDGDAVSSKDAIKVLKYAFGFKGIDLTTTEGND